MAINVPVLGIGAGFAGLSPILAPLLSPIADLVAQATPTGMPSSSVWFGLGVLVTAIGTAVIQPWLKERGTAEKLTAVTKECVELKGRVETLEQANRSKDDVIRAKEARVDDLVKQLSTTTDRLLRISGRLLETAGKIKPLTEALRPVPIDSTMPRHTVLLLEDDDDARVAMAGTLELLGFNVDAVESVTDARDAMGGKTYDAAVLDLMLPDGDGAEILRIVRQRKLPTKVIVTTGRSEDSLAPVHALKPDFLFRKPVEIPDVVAAIRGEQDGSVSGTPTLAILPVAATAVAPPVKP